MFFENEADRLLKRLFSDPFFGMGEAPARRARAAQTTERVPAGSRAQACGTMAL